MASGSFWRRRDVSGRRGRPPTIRNVKIKVSASQLLLPMPRLTDDENKQTPNCVSLIYFRSNRMGETRKKRQFMITMKRLEFDLKTKTFSISILKRLLPRGFVRHGRGRERLPKMTSL